MVPGSILCFTGNVPNSWQWRPVRSLWQRFAVRMQIWIWGWKFQHFFSVGVLKAQNGVEIGHIFHLGTQYSSLFSACFAEENDGKKSKRDVDMGCYGIGVSRLLAVLVEQHSDERGIKWPCSVAPFAVCVIPLDLAKETSGKPSPSTGFDSLNSAGELYHSLQHLTDFHG